MYKFAFNMLALDFEFGVDFFLISLKIQIVHLELWILMEYFTSAYNKLHF